MAKIGRYEGYSETQHAKREQLPVGAYVCKVLNTKLDQYPNGGQFIVFQVEITEGEFKDFYTKDYEAQKGGQYEPKYKGVYRLNLPMADGTERDRWKINASNWTFSAFTESNPGYVWDWDTESLTGKTIGINAREASYQGSTFTEIGALVSAVKVRNGTVKLMKPRGEKAAVAPNQAIIGFSPVSDDEEIPF